MQRIYTFNLPDIGEGVVEGEVIEWLKNVGDKVLKDEPVVVVMTDKATVEMPSPYAGKLKKQYVKPGHIAIKDKPLYDIEVEKEADLPKVKKQKKPLKIPKKEKTLEKRQTKILAIPRVRHLAKEMGIDLSQIQGSGKDGRVTMDDLKHVRKEKKEIFAFDDDEEEALIGIPKLMAEKMALSKRKAPHFSYFEQIDATYLIKMKEKFHTYAEKEKCRLTYMPFIIRCVSLALKQYPRVNSTLDLENNRLLVHKHHHIGIAIAKEHGLIVAVLKDVQDMTLENIIRKYAELMDKASKNQLTAADMLGSTITISNLGALGHSGRWATPVINYPEVAILAIARIQKQAMVKGDKLVVRDALNASWSFDHRVIDGKLAADFSHAFCKLIENPSLIL